MTQDLTILPKTTAEWKAAMSILPGYDPWKGALEAGLRFDEAEAARAIGFFHECLTHVEGALAGKPFILGRWQQAFVGNLFAWYRPDGSRRFREAELFVPRKNGKALSLDTPIPTPTGWTTMGEIQAGDVVFGPSGQPCNVTDVYDIIHEPESYAVAFSNGETIRACGDHLWVTTARVDCVGAGVGGRSESRRGTGTAITRPRSTREIYETQTYGSRGDRNHSLPMPAPIECAEAALPVAPYTLGAWLGDGDSDSATLTCSVDDLEMVRAIEAEGYRCGEPRKDKRTNACRVRLGMRSQRTCPRGHAPERMTAQGQCRECACVIDRAHRRGEPIPPETHNQSLHTILKGMGLLNNKHIPREYLRASVGQRLALLQGLMDTDGCVGKGGKELQYTGCRRELVEGVAELLASLGIKYSWREKQARCNGRLIDATVYMLQFCAFADELPAFRLARKLARMRKRSELTSKPRSRTVQITDVKPIAPVPMRCITVDSPTNEYLCGRTMIPTHNTPMIAGCLLFVLACDGEQGAQLYSAAADKDQAALLFRQAAGMVRNHPDLTAAIKVYGGMTRRSLVYEAQQSAYRALSSDAHTKHGLTPSVVAIDEEHALPDRELVDTLATGMASKNRKNPLLLHVTTADYDRPSICNEKHAYACAVRDGEVDDLYFLPAVYEADRDADWTDEKVWEKANPNLDISVSREYLRAECAKARANPALENTFRRLHLNQKTTTDIRWMPLHVWDDSEGLNGEKPDVWRARMIEALRGQPCVVGLDLSSKTDVTAIVAVFPPSGTREHWVVLPWFIAPKESANKRDERHSRRELESFNLWSRQGYMDISPGNWIELDAVRERIMWCCEAFDVREVAYDPWNAEAIGQELERSGIPNIRVRQGAASLSEPMKELYGLVLEREFHHGANPVLRWMMGNVAAKTDENGNIRPDKSKSTERIDGVSATITAMSRALVIDATPGWDLSNGFPSL
jgi:phage terminase large subunit-like protein